MESMSFFNKGSVEENKDFSINTVDGIALQIAQDNGIELSNIKALANLVFPAAYFYANDAQGHFPRHYDKFFNPWNGTTTLGERRSDGMYQIS